MRSFHSPDAALRPAPQPKALGVVLLIVVSIGLIAATSGLFSWWAKSAINERLVLEHRDFLRDAKVSDAPRTFWDSDAYAAKFTIEIDGVRVEYSELYKNLTLLAKLDDPELYRLAKNYRNWFLAFLISAPIFAFSFFWWLAQ